MAFATDHTYILGTTGTDPFVFGTDNGVAWDGPTTISDNNLEDGDIAFDGADALIVVGFNTHRSVDGGASFNIETIPVDTSSGTVAFGLTQFFMGGANFGTGGGALSISSGNGSWALQTTPFLQGAFDCTIRATFFDSVSSTAFIGGNQGDGTGGISLSTDLVSWSALKPNSFTAFGFSTGQINDFASNGAGTVIAAGQRGGAGGSIAHAQRSIDGGDTWIDITLSSFGGATSQLLGAAGNSSVMLMAGRNVSGTSPLQRSVDQGITWLSVDVSDILPGISTVNDVKWVEPLSLFMLGTNDASNTPVVATSPTGATGTWTVQTLAYPALGSVRAVTSSSIIIPPTPTPQPPPVRLVRDPWDVDEWGRKYPGAGYHKIL